MTNTITTGAVHHVALTVSDVARAAQFYTGLLGFQKLMELGPRILLGNGSLIIGLTPPSDSSQAITGDRFNENRLGLDHLSFSVASRADLEAAVRLLDEHSVVHGEITNLDGLGISILALRDPDNIQIELTAPTS
jgi:catechol 2,3-dioxygenase-like lactoylglutathione lyase family enzyme